MPKIGNKTQAALIALFLAFLTLAVYWPVFHCEFINYDDPQYVTENPHINTGLSWENAGWALTASYSYNWQPLAWLSHMLDCMIYGLNPAGHHATNLLFHILNTVLIFLVLRRMTGAQWRSAFVAAAFALHPLHVEPVAWISARSDLLGAFFSLLALRSYTICVESEAAIPKLHTKHFLLTFLFFTCALMSSLTTVLLPFVLLLLDIWPLERVGRADSPVPGLGAAGTPGSTPARVRQPFVFLAWEKVPLLALATGVCVITMMLQKRPGSTPSPDTGPPGLRLANAIAACCQTIAGTFRPADLAVCYPFPAGWPAWVVIGACVVLAGATFLAVRGRRRRPYLAIGWFWYWVTIIPAIVLFQRELQWRADRWAYLPLVGLLLILAWGLSDVVSRWRYSSVWLGAAAAAALAACALLTSIQTRYWRNTGTLFEHALAVTSNNAFAEQVLGMTLMREHQFEKAAMHLAEAVRIKPDYVEALNNLGLVMVVQGRIDEAILRCRQAIAAKPDIPESHANLAFVLVLKGKQDEAISEFRTAIRLNPGFSRARIELAKTLARRGRYEEAKAQWKELLLGEPDNVEAHLDLGLLLAAEKDNAGALVHLKAAVRLYPASAEAQFQLANLLSRQGQFAEALGHLSEAARLSPTNGVIRCDLAVTLDRLGRAREAVEQYQQALRLNPGMLLALNNLAWIRASNPDAGVRDGKEAVRLAEQACELTGHKRPLFLGTLSAAYAEAGRFDEAVETATQAEALARAAGYETLAERDKHLAELFRSRQPFHETPAATNSIPEPKNP